ncbi:MAG TPA: hypothetical protein VKB86_19440 [Pyrinomonadaceae bacterium]|nr:hypothetical protein [Pyrinomonadaceae bacterium]
MNVKRCGVYFKLKRHSNIKLKHNRSRDRPHVRGYRTLARVWGVKRSGDSQAAGAPNLIKN